MRLIRVIAGLALFAGGGCSPPPRSDEQLTPGAYSHWEDSLRAVAINHGMFGVGIPCAVEVIEGGTAMIGSKPVDQCYRMSRPRRWHGLWRNALEASQFCAAPSQSCSRSDPGIYVSLEFAKGLPGIHETPPGGLYEVDFVGRQTLVAEPHLRRPSKQMVVDRLISIRQIERANGFMTDEQMAAYREACKNVRICMPNSLAQQSK